jgi:hypothetical protein
MAFHSSSEDTMTLKSTFKCIPNATGWKFPCLATYDPYGPDVIVLFTENKIGTVVHSNTPYWPIGSYNNGWYMSEFNLFEGSVTIKT